MIVICRVTSETPCIVRWESSEYQYDFLGRNKRKVIVEKEKEFDNFADGNGFLLGITKKGFKAYMYLTEVDYIDSALKEIEKDKLNRGDK